MHSWTVGLGEINFAVYMILAPPVNAMNKSAIGQIPSAPAEQRTSLIVERLLSELGERTKQVLS